MTQIHTHTTNVPATAVYIIFSAMNAEQQEQGLAQQCYKQGSNQ